MSKNQKSVGLKIALPNGSLEEGTIRLFEEANLKIKKDPRKHDARIDDLLISLATFMRPQHIPSLVERGVYDVGICGSDYVEESGAAVCFVADLLYGRGTSNGLARIVLVTARRNPVERIENIEPGTIVLSEYPNITKRAFASRLPIEIRFSYGGTEAHIPRDYLYGVCLTDTGESLTANGLKIISELHKTRTVYIANMAMHHLIEKLSTGEDEIYNGPKYRDIMTLKYLLTGTLEARAFVFMTMNVTAAKKTAVLEVLPALKQPTVTRLADGGQFAIGTVVKRQEQTRVLADALHAGATDVLTQPLLQMVRSWY